MVTDITDRTQFIDSDPIEPVLIEHKTEEIIIDGRPEQEYNYIEYWFEGAGGRLRARAYLDSAHEVTIYPPVQRAADGKIEFGEDQTAREMMLSYFSRRFLVIKELGIAGHNEVWMALHADRALRYRYRP